MAEDININKAATRPWTVLPSSWRLQPKYSNLSLSASERDSKDDGPSRLKTGSNTSLDLLGAPRRDHQEGEEWIKGALFCTWGASIILALNSIMAIVATGIGYAKPSNKGQLESIALTLLLAASNYVMQCLGAPSRSDVDQAHKQRKWLDIGTFSMRNFAAMDGWRKILWTLLLISSTPIHMIYNSVVFSSISTLDYATVLIPEDLASSESLASSERLAGGENAADSFTQVVGTSPIHLRAEIFNGTFQNTSVPDCMNKYNAEFNTQLGTLIFTVDRRYFHNTSSLFGLFGDSVGSRTSIYTFLQSLESIRGQSAAQKAINDGNVTAHGLHWAYRPWNFSIPDPLPESNTYNFTLNTTAFSYDPKYSDTLNHDISVLSAYLAMYNPDRQSLGTFLATPSHWANSSWAANITFELDNRPVYPQMVYASTIGRGTELPLSGCMTKGKDQRCQLYFSPPIAIAAIVSNVIKVVRMYLTARTSRKNILLTVGDALCSFLMSPDPTTEGQCLVSRADISRGRTSWTAMTIWTRLNQSQGYRQQESVGSTAYIPLIDALSRTNTPFMDCPKMLPDKKRWCQAASAKRWTATLGFLGGCVATSVFLLVLSLTDTTNGSIPKAWTLGFGKASGQTMVQAPGISTAMISLVLLSNTPQMVLSILYFLCNSLMTCMLIADDYDDYATQRKHLRVSWPKGQQRSTYYLSLPYRYSAQLILFSVLMHWLLSQSIFFVNIQSYGVHDKLSTFRSSRGCGYSPISIFIGLLVSSVAILALLGLSCRRLKSCMPLATYCSAAISAACHPPPDYHDATLKPVMWGEVPRDMSDGLDGDRSTAYNGAGPDSLEAYAHCTFTSKEVVTPNPVRLYR
ncbi:hypothetical protein BDV38DRAFT_283815 [Aspergillus pseudotamarii]|uniref:DUF6536 domain-containing protein n=1 Tax=Aspergillus pseudotamarii TaxID=132259 RepID=A0A5N6ST86_ASPPS|nr:uncharacterized protein BDV38DRAFT_283815 [Aspergillus pseudotamarii]KAE8136603.1 hypothetical protein BDV38DRAFT_283815 [Aspergillus pseudotamarii]